MISLIYWHQFVPYSSAGVIIISIIIEWAGKIIHDCARLSRTESRWPPSFPPTPSEQDCKTRQYSLAHFKGLSIKYVTQGRKGGGECDKGREVHIELVTSYCIFETFSLFGFCDWPVRNQDICFTHLYGKYFLFYSYTENIFCCLLRSTN